MTINNSVEKSTSVYFVQEQGNPLDVRFVADNTEELNGYIAGLAYEGLLCYNLQDKKLYQYNGAKFVEFKSGDDVTSVVLADGKVTVKLASGKEIVSSGQFQDNDTCRLDTVNGRDGDHHDIYAPTTSGTNGQVLMSSGAQVAPVWADLNTLINHTIDDGTL